MPQPSGHPPGDPPPKAAPKDDAKNSGKADNPKPGSLFRRQKPPKPPRPPKQQSNRARAAQHARDDQQTKQRPRRRTATTSQQRRARPAPPRPGAPGRPLRGWRSWWATHEMDRRNRRRRRAAARSQVGGGFPAMRRWGTPTVTGVLTLLLLTLFTSAIALGAQSFTAAIVAFCFFAAALAVATAAQARAVYNAEPADTEPPLEDVADLRIDDITISDEPDSREVASVADLQRSFTHAQTPADESAPAALGSAAPSPKAAPGPDDVEPEDADEEDSEDSTDRDDDDAADDDNDADNDDAADDDDAIPLPAGVDTPLLAPEELAELDSAVPEVPAPRAAPDDAAAPSDAKVTPPDGSNDEPANDTEPAGAAGSDVDAVPEPDGAALSLLAAETPGSDLLSAYTSSHTQPPPAAVRDVAATLIVSDLDRSIMFYTELLGLVEIDRAPDAVLLEAGFGRVLLWRRDDAPGAGDPVMHLTFEVGDIDAAYETLSAKGVRFTHPPVSALSGEVHKLRAASFLDPDGHGLALTELREH